jgi:hypothetical protein
MDFATTRWPCGSSWSTARDTVSRDGSGIPGPLRIKGATGSPLNMVAVF